MKITTLLSGFIFMVFAIFALEFHIVNNFEEISPYYIVSVCALFTISGFLIGTVWTGWVEKKNENDSNKNKRRD